MSWMRGRCSLSGGDRNMWICGVAIMIHQIAKMEIYEADTCCAGALL